MGDALLRLFRPGLRWLAGAFCRTQSQAKRGDSFVWRSIAFLLQIQGGNEMQLNKEYERVISVRDLFFHLLYRWRSILAAALIGALLLGGYAWISNRKSAVLKAQIAETADENREDEEAIGFVQNSYNASNQLYSNLLMDLREYRENSLILNVNPYRVWKARLVFAVIPEGTEGVMPNDQAAQIAAAYPAQILAAYDPEELGRIYEGADLNYIGEVVSSEAVPGAGTFSVTVIALTEKMAEEAGTYFEDVITQTSWEEIQQAGKHRIIELARDIRRTVDTEIEARQAAVALNIAAYQTAISDNNNSISKAPAVVKAAANTVRKSKIRYAVIGFVFGAVFLVCCYFVLYLLGGKLRSAAELTDGFGVPVYGVLNHSRARRPGKGIDKLIEKWEFRKTKTNPETVLDGICALIRQQRSSGSILLTGTLPSDRLTGIADRLKERLGSEIECRAEGDFLHNVRKVAEEGKTAMVIIAEEQHRSETEEIRRMLELLSLGKIEVTGAIVA